VFCGALVGASLGFLWYNAHPAEIFMEMWGRSRWRDARRDRGHHQAGDSCLRWRRFVLEAVSVILQVGSFKLRGSAFFEWRPSITFRIARLERIESDRAVLDRRAGFCAVCADDVEVAVAGKDIAQRCRIV